ncbi:MAG: prephenate dehydratase domain-containing protein [Bdellovibrionota bacterium]
MASLEDLRRSLDGIDDEVARLLHRRAEIVLEVKKTKEKENIDIYSPTRERQILDRVLSLVPDGQFPRGALERIFSNIISATRSLIGQLNVSYVGPEGSLGYNAGLKQFGETLKFCPEANIEEVFAKVESGDSHFGVVPIRTSAGTNVVKTIELLTRSPLVIIAELEVKERLGLLGEGSSLTELQQVFSDAYSFHRSLSWIRSTLPGAHLELVDNAELAVKMVKGDQFSAAVALESVAEKAQLKVLASGIDSESGSDARFVVIGTKTPAPTGNDKTSLVCAAEDRAGALREILRPFSEKGVTLLKIESQPMSGKTWESIFFIDAVGHQSDPSLSAVIQQLSSLSTHLKVLGSYPLVCRS